MTASKAGYTGLLPEQEARDLYALRRAGFVRIGGFLRHQEVERLMALARAFEDETEDFVKMGGHASRRHQHPLRTTRCLFAIGKEFQDLALNETIARYVSGYLGAAWLRDCQLQTNVPDKANRTRGIHGDVSFHRDTLFHEAIAPAYLHVMVALTVSCKENGATIVVPGSHGEREPEYYFKHHDPRPSQPGSDYPVYPQRYFPSAVSIECDPGDLVLLDPMTIHSHGINTTDKPRCLLSMPFRRRDARAEPTLLDVRSIARKHARVPISREFFDLLDNDCTGPASFGSLGG